MKLSEFRYISNILSLSRVVLTVPIWYMLSLESRTGDYLAVVIMLLAALTDAYDGRLARKLHQKSDLGRFLDPIADKLCIGVIVIMLVKTRNMPLWFVVLIIGRDLVILLLASVMSLKSKSVVESNMLGKITVTALAVTVVAFTLDWPVMKEVFMWASVVLILASSLSYLLKFKADIFRTHRG